MLVFLFRDQLGHIGERLDTLPPCDTEHCFACHFQDVPLAEVEEVRPHLPTRIFVKDNNQWRRASPVSCFFQYSCTLYKLCSPSLAVYMHPWLARACMVLTYCICACMQIEREQLIAPHPVVDGAQGRPVRMCPIILYSDDTSGNLSKKWNCFNIWCVQLAALPRSENAKLQNIFYITCSNAVQSEFTLW